jgi:hypothetical protein
VWARIATSGDQREQFLELAKKWMSDAESIDQRIELRAKETAKASEMAGEEVDRLGDPLATDEEAHTCASPIGLPWALVTERPVALPPIWLEEGSYSLSSPSALPVARHIRTRRLTTRRESKRAPVSLPGLRRHLMLKSKGSLP